MHGPRDVSVFDEMGMILAALVRAASRHRDFDFYAVARRAVARLYTIGVEPAECVGPSGVRVVSLLVDDTAGRISIGVPADEEPGLYAVFHALNRFHEDPRADRWFQVYAKACRAHIQATRGESP